jgi:hypothetical protein
MAASGRWRKWVCFVLVLLAATPPCLFVARDARQHDLDSALLRAIKRRDATRVALLLNQGADPNARDVAYERPTISVAWRAIVNMFTGRRASKPDVKYRPALLLVYERVSYCPPEWWIAIIVNVAGGPDIDGTVDSRSAITNKAAAKGIVGALLAHGARLDVPASGGRSVTVGEALLAYACMCDDADTIRLLLQHRVNANSPGELRSYLPLECTVDPDCVRILLEFGANPNGRDGDGATRIMYVPNVKIYPILFQYGADPNAQDSAGRTPLIRLFVSHILSDDAIHAGMRCLIEHGGRVQIKDRTGRTALDYAREGKSNMLTPGFTPGEYDRASIRYLEGALRKERGDRL